MTPPKDPASSLPNAQVLVSKGPAQRAACSLQHDAAHVAEKHHSHEGSGTGNTDIDSFNCTDAKSMSIKCPMDTFLKKCFYPNF